MKLRCTHNSIRLRLRKSDLESLKQDGIIQESVQLSPQVSFSFTLKITTQQESISVDMQDANLIINLPDMQANSWMNSSQIGIEQSQSIDTQQKLHILIEKDFPCKDRPEEDKSDTFWELNTQDEHC